MHEEIVIIPHPNELKRLSDWQRKLSASLSHGGEIWMPCFPLYVMMADKAGISGWGKAICGCTLAGVRAEGDTIVADAEIAATPCGEKIAGKLEIARKLQEAKPGEQNTVACSVAASSADCADSLFPLRLPVFRVAKVLFSQENARTEWTVTESKWIKISRPAVQQ